MKTAEDILEDKQRDIVSISWDQTVHQACRKMVDNKIGAILVKKDDEFVGIWSERDLLRNITSEGFDPKKAKVGDYMTSPLRTASHQYPHLQAGRNVSGIVSETHPHRKRWRVHRHAFNRRCAQSRPA
jgi:signal-transduction protein with cAMP-binding, CBS, and nucleotidyltransferase domain